MSLKIIVANHARFKENDVKNSKVSLTLPIYVLSSHSYSCACHHGFKLLRDGSTCRGTYVKKRTCDKFGFATAVVISESFALLRVVNLCSQLI